MRYKAIFFDLDDTIWDFKKNSVNAIDHIRKIYQEKYDLKIESNIFKNIYEEKNSILWDEYRRGRRSSNSISYTRFIDVGKHFDIEIGLEESKIIASSYLEELYKGTILIDGAIEILEYLSNNYVLGLITNGFKQGLIRLERCGIKKYFKYTISSEEFGHPKPKADIFIHSAKKVNISPQECIYIGDNYEGDIIGAKKSGLGSIFFNPKEKPFSTYEIQPDYSIKRLDELKRIF